MSSFSCRAHCVYCSPLTGDLIIGMWNYDTNTCIIKRYNITEKLQSRNQPKIIGQIENCCPTLITETLMAISLWLGFSVVFWGWIVRDDIGFHTKSLNPVFRSGQRGYVQTLYYIYWFLTHLTLLFICLTNMVSFYVTF